ncbi:hypothetical protein LOTGIDRAFT_169983 [Lottia gigantea]|uniref:Major facilitator superfamily (MFS) profile domain-containing protein n=1 Tax=Lottia gigantea TaxID=225164 RepID=V4B273_LOTGI|nr:hypothetical protein LOTGIDRAFT_169983 [Lottia gigantea]ESO82364.1 hypothetical protein LOTGIDRAFT_169983 [Lottia gigantea]
MVEVKRYCNLIGCAAVMMTICVPYFFGNLITNTISYLYFLGNLITYTISYLHSRGLYDESNLGDENWILAPVAMLHGVGTFLGACLHKRLHIKCCFLIPCGIFLWGFLLTYYTVSYSIWSIALTFGGISGAASGMSYALSVYVATQTFSERVGTATSIILTGFSSGGIFLNALITLIINPKNLSPNMELNKYRIFNQTEIIDRVPSTYIYLGIILASIQLIGSLLITKPDSTTHTNYEVLNENQSSSQSVEPVDVTTKEILKDVRSYTLWFIVCFGVTTPVLIQSVYKNFGQNFIDDDQFLATVGSTLAFSNIFFRLAVGISADKCGIKMTFLWTYIPCIILLFTIYQVQFLPRIWYLIWVNALSCLLSNVFILLPISVRQLFGSKHFMMNYAVFWNGAALGGFALPLTVKYLVTIGWQTLFFVFGGVVSLSTVLVMLLKLPLFPKCNKNVKDSLIELKPQMNDKDNVKEDGNCSVSD